MKTMPSVATMLVLLLGLGLVLAFPKERDVETVEKTDSSSEEDEAAPGSGFVYIPSFYNLFPDFELVSRIRGLVTRLRDQIGDSFGDVDWSKGNTTSTTKVVDGHVVTVNETSYKDDESDLVLHIKVIDVKPTEGAEDVEPAVESTSRSTEHDESEGNEIPKQEDELAESFLDFDTAHQTPKVHQIETREYEAPDYSANDVEDYPVDEVDNSVDVFAQPPYDLGRDIYINKLMSDKTMSQGMFEVPPDVEVFSADDRHIYETIPAHSEPIRQWNDGRPQRASVHSEPIRHWNNGRPQAIPLHSEPIRYWNDGRPQTAPIRSEPIRQWNDGRPETIPVHSAPLRLWNVGRHETAPVHSTPVKHRDDERFR